MSLSENLTENYQSLYRLKFGIDITKSGAEQELSDLASLIREILRRKEKE